MDSDSVAVGALRGFLLAVWSWLVIAGLLTMLVVSRARTVTVVAPTDGPSDGPPVAGPDAFEVFGSIVTFQFGASPIDPARSALAFVAGRAGQTALVLAVALAFTIVLAASLITLARRTGPTGRRAVVGSAVVCGALPAFGLLSVLIGLSLAGVPLPTRWQGGLDVFVPALALAVPLTGLAVRTADRFDRDGGWLQDGWLLDGWLTLAWVLGAVVAVEYLFEIRGVGALWYSSLVRQDVTVFVAATAVLTVPLLVGLVLREAARTVGPPPAAASNAARHVGDGGRRGSTDRHRSVRLRTDRRLLAGAVAVIGLLVVGTVGLLTYTPGAAPAPSPGGLSLPVVVAALGGVVVPAAVAVGVGAAAGVPLGVLAARVEALRPVVSGLFEPFRAVPPVLLLAIGVVLFAARDAVALSGTVGPLVGLALAPVAVRTTADELAARDDAFAAATRAVGALCSAGAVVVLAVGAAAFLGLWGRVPSRVLAPGGAIASPTAVAALVLTVTLPAVGFAVVGRQLRR